MLEGSSKIFLNAIAVFSRHLEKGFLSCKTVFTLISSYLESQQYGEAALIDVLGGSISTKQEGYQTFQDSH